MQTIIEQVLTEEENARKRIEEARRNSSSIKSGADEEADAILAKARLQAATWTKERIEKARQDAQTFILRVSAEEEQKNMGLYESARAKIPALSTEVSVTVLQTEIRKD